MCQHHVIYDVTLVTGLYDAKFLLTPRAKTFSCQKYKIIKYEMCMQELKLLYL